MPINSHLQKRIVKEVSYPCTYSSGVPFDLVLTNAVYFKGLWEYTFDKKDTSQQSFRTDEGPEVQVSRGTGGEIVVCSA